MTLTIFLAIPRVPGSLATSQWSRNKWICLHSHQLLSLAWCQTSCPLVSWRTFLLVRKWTFWVPSLDFQGPTNSQVPWYQSSFLKRPPIWKAHTSLFCNSGYTNLTEHLVLRWFLKAWTEKWTPVNAEEMLELPWQSADRIKRLSEVGTVERTYWVRPENPPTDDKPDGPRDTPFS